jgi:hypothetical protein
MQALEERLSEDALTYREQRALTAELARLRWQLSSYPDSTRPARRKSAPSVEVEVNADH